MERLKGIIPVTTSPVHADGTLDEEGHHRIIDHTMAHPIGGYWILGSAGEDFLIGHADRVRIARLYAEHVDGRLPVIVGCGQPVLDDTFRFFDDTADLKTAAYHLLPCDRKMKPSLTIRYVTMVADRAPKPIWLYNNELRALKIPVPAVEVLKDHPNIAGIKAGGYDLKDIVPLCMMNGPDLQTIGSGGGHLMLFLAMGCEAHTISPATSFPQRYCEAFSLWQRGDIAGAREIAFAMGRIIKALPHPENTEFSAEEKAVLEVLGVCKRHVYPPFAACTDAEVEQARRVLKEGGII